MIEGCVTWVVPRKKNVDALSSSVSQIQLFMQELCDEVAVLAVAVAAVVPIVVVFVVKVQSVILCCMPSLYRAGNKNVTTSAFHSSRQC